MIDMQELEALQAANDIETLVHASAQLEREAIGEGMVRVFCKPCRAKFGIKGKTEKGSM